MHKLKMLQQLGQLALAKTLFNKIFHRFDVMVGGALKLFHQFRVGEAKTINNGVQAGTGLGG